MKSNYVIAAYGGARRDKNEEYEADRSYFLREHFAALCEVENSLSLVTVVAPPVGSDPKEEAFEDFVANLAGLLPGDTEIRFLRRKTNAGFSYGSWADAYEQSVSAGEDFDFWWFVEDDYVFIPDRFDELLTSQIEEDPMCGYLASLVFGRQNPGYHAAMPHGLLRGEALKSIRHACGRLPHSPSVDDYIKVVVDGQCGFSLEMERKTKWRLRSTTDRWISLFRNCQDSSVEAYSDQSTPFPVLISPTQCWREVRSNGWKGAIKVPCFE